MPLEPQNQDLTARAEEIFRAAPFIQHLGIRLKGCGPGWCETLLTIRPEHLQQDGVIHAGVLATMADHTAGASAGTLIKKNEIVLTVEFKINLLRPAKGSTLRTRAEVIKAGRNITVSESEVFSLEDGEEKLSAKGMVTLAVVERRG